MSARPATRHLVLFARAPRLGAVKRRLAADIGPLAACVFYRTTLAAVGRRLGRDPRWRTWLAVTPDRDAADPALWPVPPGTIVIGQGGGDLGARMARPLRILPPGPVIVVGSDIPGVLPAHIACAFAALGRHDLVFGPAADGGFWLAGAKRTPVLPRGLFAGARWGTAHALADVLAGLAPGTRTAFVDTLSDVDDGADYRRWRAGDL